MTLQSADPRSLDLGKPLGHHTPWWVWSDTYRREMLAREVAQRLRFCDRAVVDHALEQFVRLEQTRPDRVHGLNARIVDVGPA